MTQVDFYVLQSPAHQSREHFVCRLIEKAYSLKNNVHVEVNDEYQATMLDTMLWEFKPERFIPHSIRNAVEEELPNEPIIIAYQQQPAHIDDLLINLSDETPLFFTRFARVAEIVGSDDEQKELARKRYRFYKERGYKINTHNL